MARSLEGFLRDTEDQLSDILSAVGWTYDETFKSKSSKASSYTSETTEEYPESVNEQPTTSVTLDEDLLHALLNRPQKIPQSHKESILNLTRDERLLIYNYAIQSTGHLKEPELIISFPTENEGIKRLTLAEIMQLQKQQKRRRMKYRVAKIPPTSYQEEIRGLIEMQMEAFVQYLNVTLKSNVPESDVRRRDEKTKRHRSRSRSPYKHQRRKRSRSKRRRRSRSRSRYYSHRRD